MRVKLQTFFFIHFSLYMAAFLTYIHINAHAHEHTHTLNFLLQLRTNTQLGQLSQGAFCPATLLLHGYRANE